MNNDDIVYIEDVTGTIGRWLSQDMSDIPPQAIQYLEKAYDICAAEYACNMN